MKNFAGNKRINAWLAAFLVTAVLFLSAFLLSRTQNISVRVRTVPSAPR